MFDLNKTDSKSEFALLLDWKELKPEDKKKELYYRQKHTLDLFFEKGAISREQRDKSLYDLTKKWVCDFYSYMF